MVEKSVKLITPCNASERWPLGYRIYQEGTFTNIDELKVLLQEMIERHMPPAVQLKDRISFRRDLKYEILPNGFQVSTQFKKYKFCNTSYFQLLGGMIDRGNKTAEEITASFHICGIPSDYIYQSLNLMFENGLLEDEPLYLSTNN